MVREKSWMSLQKLNEYYFFCHFFVPPKRDNQKMARKPPPEWNGQEYTTWFSEFALIKLLYYCG